MIKIIFAFFLIAVLLAGTIAPVSFAKGLDSIPGKPEVIGVTGFVPGQNLTVHILVLVHPGEDKKEVAAAALASQGARPFTAEEFSLTKLVWKQFSDDTLNPTVPQYYNSNSDPYRPAGLAAFLNTHDSWNGVATSNFEFSYEGPTDRCPSLVRECDGRQVYDGNNDVAWMDLKKKGILGVTWSGTSSSTGPEADVVLNTKFSWATNGADFDIETVLLHEEGHVAGIGHSEDNEAIMYPSYKKPNPKLGEDDKDAISFKYPQPQIGESPTVSITSPVNDLNYDSGSSILFTATASDIEDESITDMSWTSNEDDLITLDGSSEATLPNGPHIVTVTVTDSDGNSSSDSITITVGTIQPPLLGDINSEIEFATDVKKRFNNLLITVSATDGSGSSVSNVSVQLTLERVGGGPWNFGGSTDETGSVTFKLMKARSGEDYTATITNWSSVFVGGELDDCAYINSDNIAVTCGT